MTIEHSIITDPNIHEPKGVASASSGQIYVADGLGSGAWGLNLRDVTLTTVLSAESTTTQGPSTTDTAYQILFGAAQGSGVDDVMLDVAGNITFNTAGTYMVKHVFHVGRTGGAGVAEIFFRELLDGTPFDTLSYLRLDDAEVLYRIHDAHLINVTAAQVMTFEMYRDSTGNNSGSLIATAATGISAWGTSPSSCIEIEKVSV